MRGQGKRGEEKGRIGEETARKNRRSDSGLPGTLCPFPHHPLLCPTSPASTRTIARRFKERGEKFGPLTEKILLTQCAHVIVVIHIVNFENEYLLHLKEVVELAHNFQIHAADLAKTAHAHVKSHFYLP